MTWTREGKKKRGRGGTEVPRGRRQTMLGREEGGEGWRESTMYKQTQHAIKIEKTSEFEI